MNRSNISTSSNRRFSLGEMNEMRSEKNDPTTNNQTIPFQILKVSSEDPHHPIASLESSSNETNNDVSNSRNDEHPGWQSEKNCTYPQYIILQPVNNHQKSHNGINSSDSENNALIHLTQMQILAHNQYIPTRIDIFVSEAEKCIDNIQQPLPSTFPSSSSSSSSSSPDAWDNNHNIHFQRLGYITFDDNSKTNYRARELKSISLDIKVTYIKLVIHSCHKCQQIHHEDKIQNSIMLRNSVGLEKSSSSSNSSTNRNEMNPFHQVGIVKILLIGKKIFPGGKSPFRNNKERSIMFDDDNLLVRKSNEDKVEEKIEKASIGINTTFAKIVSPSIGSSINNRKGSKPRRKKKSLNFDMEEFKSRLSILEKKKLDMAAREDFDKAAKIKAIITEINTTFTNFQTFQNEMRKAAESEDYLKASQLKLKRDKSYITAMDALEMAEKNIEELAKSLVETSPSSNNSTQSVNEFKMINTQLEDLSLSTIRRFDEDDPSVAMTMTGRSFQLNIDERPIVSRQSNVEHSAIKENDDDSDNAKDKLSKSLGDGENDGEHPLKGVPEYENLPYPEDLHDAEGGLAISLSSSSSIVSTDSILKIEAILGRYRTKCFLSKNWALREAALIKLSMILPDVVEKYKSDYVVEHEWLDTFLRSLCIILERAIDDKIVQVYLTGLILLDDCICVIEKFQMSQKVVISLLSNTVLNLVDKLSSSNQKVVEGAETALMSLALFEGVGPTYIGSQIMKRTSSKGKLLSSKFRILRDMIHEFDEDAPSGQKIMDFVKTNGFGHKDAEVRETAKELTTALYLRDGSLVASMLDGLSERQIKEYKLSFSVAKQKELKRNGVEPSRENNEKLSTPESNDAEINRLLTPNPNQSKQAVAATPRGRGRGRGRRSTSKGVDRIGQIPHPSRGRINTNNYDMNT